MRVVRWSLRAVGGLLQAGGKKGLGAGGEKRGQLVYTQGSRCLI